MSLLDDRIRAAQADLDLLRGYETARDLLGLVRDQNRELASEADAARRALLAKDAHMAHALLAASGGRPVPLPEQDHVEGALREILGHCKHTSRRMTAEASEKDPPRIAKWSLELAPEDLLSTAQAVALQIEGRGWIVEARWMPGGLGVLTLLHESLAHEGYGVV
jgi:hypothetical protein